MLFCSGSCQKYLHRYCASVSEQAFKSLTSEDAEPFLCFCCYKAQKEKQVATLLSAVESLKDEINTLKIATAATAATASSAALNSTGPGKLLSFSQVCARQPGDSPHPRP